MAKQHKHNKGYKAPQYPVYRRGERVSTPDGLGIIVGHSIRKNSNDGPGCHEYVVQLDNGKIRHYSSGETLLA
jgi:hypothetical protein